jgi:hypothetical protein
MLTLLRMIFIPYKVCLILNINYYICLLGDFSDPYLTGIMDCHPLILIIMETTKLKVDTNDSSICYLGVNQHNYLDSGCTCLTIFYCHVLLTRHGVCMDD